MINNTTKKLQIMRTQARKIYTNEDLKSMLALEIEKYGEGVWSDRRKTIEEMLRMRGVKF
jgi:ABC-type uncharacterized transport system auxiliary subunit